MTPTRTLQATLLLSSPISGVCVCDNIVRLFSRNPFSCCDFCVLHTLCSSEGSAEESASFVVKSVMVRSRASYQIVGSYVLFALDCEGSGCIP